MVSSIVLYYNRFIILFTQIIHIKQLNRKMKHFHLTIQCLEKYTRPVQQLAYRGWHWVNKQEELLTRRGRGSGRWWSWRIISNRRGGQAAISLNLGNACWHLWRFTAWKFVHRGLNVLNRFVGCHLKSNQLSIKIRTLEWSQSVQTEMLILTTWTVTVSHSPGGGSDSCVQCCAHPCMSA